MKDYEVKEKLITTGAIIGLIIIIKLIPLIPIGSDTEAVNDEHTVGTDLIEMTLSEEFDSCEAEDVTDIGFHTHTTPNVERSFFSSNNTYLMFENIDEEEFVKYFDPNYDLLVRESKPHDLYEFSEDRLKGRIIEGHDGNEYKHYFIIGVSSGNSKNVCFIECFSKNSEILDEILENFNTLEDISEKYPDAISPEEVKDHLGEVVTVKGALVASDRQRLSDYSPWIIALDEYQSENHVSVYLYRELWGDNIDYITGGDYSFGTARYFQTIYVTGIVEYEKQLEEYGGDYYAVKPSIINDIIFDETSCFHKY